VDADLYEEATWSTDAVRAADPAWLPPVPAEKRERLTFLIRATGSHVPVICITGSSGNHDAFADATFEQDSSELLTCVGELLKSKARMWTVPPIR